MIQCNKNITHNEYFTFSITTTHKYVRGKCNGNARVVRKLSENKENKSDHSNFQLNMFSHTHTQVHDLYITFGKF